MRELHDRNIIKWPQRRQAGIRFGWSFPYYSRALDFPSESWFRFILLNSITGHREKPLRLMNASLFRSSPLPQLLTFLLMTATFSSFAQTNTNTVLPVV